MMDASIVLLGVNHKTTPVEIREKLALTGGYEQYLQELASLDSLSEVFLLSTCNRVEIIFISSDPEKSRRDILDKLFQTKVERKEVAGCFYMLQNQEAVQHLFMVSASLDSMIVGEAQILGQLKEAYRYAADCKTVRLLLNRLLHKAFAVAKRVRTETAIGANAVSISYAAVELAKKIFGSLGGKKVMLVGAGEMAELAAEHLLGQGAADIAVANRTLENAVELARKFNGKAVSLREMTEQLFEVDIIISSTGATTTILQKDEVAAVMHKRRNRPLFFIDIAVPRNLDPAINELDNVYLYDIDDLHQVVDKNRSQREAEALKASRIVEEETIKFSKWLEIMDVTPTIKQLRDFAADICRQEVAKTMSRLDCKDRLDQGAMESMARAIANKLLHHPTQYLKGYHHCLSKEERVNRVRKVFNLPSEIGTDDRRI